MDVIRKEAWLFYRTIFGVRLCWELEEPKGPKGQEGRVSVPKRGSVSRANNLRVQFDRVGGHTGVPRS